MRRLRLDLLGVVAVLAVAACVLSLPAAVRATSVLTVTTTLDSGPGSLRQAITDANAAPGSSIVFDIPLSDPGFTGQWFVIQPLTALPPLTQSSTTIDGSTQTGNTNPTGPAIELDGRFASGTGLTISSSNDVVRDLSIDRFQAPASQTPGGIQVNGSQTLITQCFIGADPSGVLAGNGNNGISFGSDSNQIIGNLIADNSAVGIGNFSGNDNVIQGNRIEHNGLIGIDTGGGGTLIGGTGPGQGNVVSGNGNGGIGIEGSGVIVQGNLIGTDATGESAEANGGTGVSVIGEDATIGGTTLAARNVISGNVVSGVSVDGSADGTTVEGNYIGTDAAGTAALGNAVGNCGCDPAYAGISISGAPTGASQIAIRGNLVSGNGSPDIDALNTGAAVITIQGNLIGTDAGGTEHLSSGGVSLLANVTDALIGGSTSSTRNVVGSVFVGTGSTGTVISGNYIGTDAAGTAMWPDQHSGVGLAPGSSSTTVGGTTAGAGNLIESGSGFGAVVVSGTVTGTTIQGNLIGTDATGAHAIASTVPTGTGVLIQGDDSTVGGAASGAPNTIAFNGEDGVAVASGSGNAISRNSIFANGGLGIDLGSDGVTPNDPGDTDSGPNNLQNFPVLTSVVASSGHVTVMGSLDTANPHAATVEFFANPQPDPGGDTSGYGEGAVFLGTATPAANGSFTATLPSVAPGALISATATDASGNTSEFALDIVLASTAAPTVASLSPDHGPAGTSVTITGSGFAGATAVAFGGTAAQSFAVGSDSTITATVAAGTSTGPVSVTGPGGTATSSALFYLPPTVGGFSPTNAAERATVTVTGTNFTGATQVQLGGVDVPFSVASNVRLTFTVPVGSAGGTIHVTAPSGSATTAGSVTILPPPAITSIAPLSGPVGTTVTITGTNLGGTVGVMLGSVVTVPTSVNGTTVTFTLPPGAATGHLKVLTTSGSATSTDTFTVTG